MAIKNIVDRSNLGNDFDIGVIEANKIHVKIDGATLKKNGAGVIRVEPSNLISADAPNGLTSGTDGKLVSASQSNVRYGAVVPSVLPTDKKNDTYILTTDGTSATAVLTEWVFDGTIWKKVTPNVDALVDFSVNADPNTGGTTFSPNVPTSTEVLYRSTIDNSLWAWNGTTYVTTTPASIVSGNIIAMTPFGSGVGTVVTFDGMKVRWSQQLGSGYDAIEIATITAPRTVRMSNQETYGGASKFDSADAVWGGQGVFYNSATLADTGNATFPHDKIITTTFQMIGNYGMFQHNVRRVLLEDVTNSQRYILHIWKKASTGETGVQNGIVDIWVEKIGITTSQIYSAGRDISISGGLIGSTYQKGRFTLGDVASGVGALPVGGDITSAVKANAVGDSTVTVTFVGYGNLNYFVILQPESLGVIGFDNDIRPLVFKKVSATQFTVYFEETGGVAQNLLVHCLIIPY